MFMLKSQPAVRRATRVLRSVVFALVAVMAIGAVPARSLHAQQSDAAQQAYRDKREQLLKELEQTQQQLADIRNQRVELQARIEAVIAQMMQQRAQQLLLSNETNALQQLDAMLTSSQDNLLAQRDRFLAIGDAVRRRTGAVMVVLMRADSSTSAQEIGAVTLTIDGAAADTRTYTTASNEALRIGAVDQLYRANVLPASHTVSLNVTVGGQTLTQQVNVTAATEAVTYVQFALRNGVLTPTTWSSRGTTPF
jgi:septal ring factor EnvC (AmiA/AmiB activator)